MKAFRITAVSVIVMLLAVCLLAPSSSAASADTSGAQYFDSTRYSGEVELQGGSTLLSGSTCYVYTYEEYQKLMSTGHGEYTRVDKDQTLCSESGTYGIVSGGNSFQAIHGASVVSKTLSRMDSFSYSFTGMKEANIGIHIDVDKHGASSTTRVLVVKSTAVSGVRSVGVADFWNNKDYQSYILYKCEYASDVSSIDFSFKCTNTDNYCVFVSMDDGVAASYNMHVSGVAEFTDSNVLSIVMIVVALLLLGVLLYISNKKLIK